MRIFLVAALSLGAVLAQAPPPPVVNPRGVLNAFSLEPAPSRVTPGGLLFIRGLNFGSPEGVRATSVPLPMQLGDPPVEVRINARTAPILSVSPSLIVVQVPWEVARGTARVVVRRGEEQSRAATVQIVAALPAVRTTDDKGYGPAAAETAGNAIKLRVTGLGVTEPAGETGQPGAREAASQPRQTVQAYVGGLPAEASAVLSPERVGEYDVEVKIPEGAVAGDPITIKAGPQAPANRPAFGRAEGALLRYLPLPSGDAGIRRVVDADLRAGYLIASAARGEDGCYPSVLFDFGRSRAEAIGDCLIAAGPNAATPIITMGEGSALAAMKGPADGEAASGLTSKVLLFNPAKDAPIEVETPAKVSLLQPNPSGVITAVSPGEPPELFGINSQSGEVNPLEPAPAQAAAAASVIRLNPQTLEIDLGEGLTKILSAPVLARQGVFALVIGDDEDKPTRAKLALLNARAEVLETRDFPEGWVPLVPPPVPAQTATPGTGQPGTGTPARPGVPGGQPGGGGGQPGAGGGQPQLPQAPAAGGVPAQAIRFRVPLTADAATTSLYVPLANLDKSVHGLLVFHGEGLEAERMPLPEGWYMTACTPTVRLFNLELSRRLAFLGSTRPETEFRNPCPADGFLVLNLADRSLTAVRLSGQGQFNAAANSGDINDFLYGTNTDPSNRGIADTLFVLDSVAGNSFRMDLPTGITGFANLRPVAALSALLGQASNQTVGDAGLVWFDLATEQSRVFPVPEGFQVMTPVEVFPSVRKLVARGVLTGNTGSQYLIFDLETGDLAMPPNPEGIVHVGQSPRPAGATATQVVQIQMANLKSNQVVAGGFNEAGQLAGILLLHVP